MPIGEKHLAAWKEKYNGLQGRIAKVQDKANGVVETVIDATVTTGTAFALGVTDGRTGGKHVLGVPVPLVIAGVAHVAGFMGVGGKASYLAHSVGNGALAAFGYASGRSIGLEWEEKARKEGKTKVSGDDDVSTSIDGGSGSSALSPEELAAIAAM